FTTEGKSDDYINYYNRNTLDVHSYEKVIYHDIYPNIDWVIYTNEEGLKYDFIVHPGGDPSQIKMAYSDQETITLDDHGNLQIGTALGNYSELAPVSFQGDKSVATSFERKGDVCSFILGEYNRTQTLVIDPLVRVWGTYYGGAAIDYALSSTTDQNNHVYLTGRTDNTTSIASGGHQNTYGGGTDAFLVKFDSNGNRIWATYYGGSGYDLGLSLAADAAGNIFLAGRTYSPNNIGFNGYQNSFGNGLNDAFLVKFNSAGIRQWATYYGGSLATGSGGGGDDSGNGVAVDGSGNVFLSGATNSTGAIAFNGFQNSVGGGYDAYLVKFNTSGVRQWATYYGGSLDDGAKSVAVDGSGNVYIAGNTLSTASIAILGQQNTIGGMQDGFLVKFNSAGARQWATYNGGAADEDCFSVCTDLSNNIYICGRTWSSDLISFNGHQNSKNGQSDAYLVKFNSSGVRQWGTYYGGATWTFGNPTTQAFSTRTDLTGNVFLAGITNTTSGIASNGFKNSISGDSDAFLVKFNAAGVRQWGTYYGGLAFEMWSAVSIDNIGNPYLSGLTVSSDNIAFNGFQNVIGDPNTNDAYLVKFKECTNTTNTINQSSCGTFTLNSSTYTSSGTYTQTLTNVAGCDSIITLNLTINPLPTATITPAGATTFCQGASVVLNANTGTGLSYQWKNNGANISGATAASYTATAAGSYTVFVTNSNSCSATSTALSITVNPLPTATITPAGATTFCQGASVVLNANTGTGLTYQWKDNGTNISGATAASYTATAAGSYTVVVTNSNSCSATSTALSITVNPLPTATITPAGATTFCQGVSVVLNANTGTGLSYQWKNNGANISGATAASYTATAAGSYTVVVTNSNSCSATSTALSITVNPLPTATITPAGATTFCQGASVVLNANTGTG
ncbi:MAG: SBBP repeat-containing protein, partial [Flavobacteriia bacterium]